MKDKETYVRCEFCNSLILDQSPPSKMSYANAEIYLAPSSSILLPLTISKEGEKAVMIDGYYCKPECLVNRINEILKK